MKEVIYLGNANGIKNLVARKKYPVEFEGDEVYMITNEAGKRISYSKRFFEEEPAAVPLYPPTPPAPVSSVALVMDTEFPNVQCTLTLRDFSTNFRLTISATEISCGILQMSNMSALLGAIDDAATQLRLTASEIEELTEIVVTRFFDDLEEHVTTGMIIFSISESNNDVQSPIFRTFLNYINNEENDIVSTDWVSNPNTGNMIGLYAFMLGEPAD